MEELISRAAADLARSKYAVALTGAGMSTESGIPDFRGPNGVWTKDPSAERRAYLAYDKYLSNPSAYWEERLSTPSVLGNLGDYLPNPGHYALAQMESFGVLKTVITQNVDNLHQTSGSQHVLDYHGNAFKLRCPACLSRYTLDDYDLAELRQARHLPPLCNNCGGPLKPDTVHFGEPIPPDVAEHSLEEAGLCDVMLVCGTSAVVYPFAELPRLARLRAKVVIIEVNAEPTPLTIEGISSYIIKGKTGEILPRICEQVERIKKG